MLKSKRGSRGQSTLEYLILVAGVIAILIVFLNPTGGVFSNKLNQTLEDATDGMTDMAIRLKSSRGTQPNGTN